MLNCCCVTRVQFFKQTLVNVISCSGSLLHARCLTFFWTKLSCATMSVSYRDWVAHWRDKRNLIIFFIRTELLGLSSSSVGFIIHNMRFTLPQWRKAHGRTQTIRSCIITLHEKKYLVLTTLNKAWNPCMDAVIYKYTHYYKNNTNIGDKCRIILW